MKIKKLLNQAKQTTLGVLFTALGGCAHSPPTSLSATLTPQQQLNALQHWQAQGRFAVSQHQQGTHAAFTWHQQGEYYQIRLFGPFGAGVHIIGGANQVLVKESNGKITRAATPEQLIEKVLGLPLPLSGLQYWLKGIPFAHQPYTLQLDAYQRLRQLQQTHWHIDYHYPTHHFSLLPNQLQLQNGELKVKLVITQWKMLKPLPSPRLPK